MLKLLCWSILPKGCQALLSCTTFSCIARACCARFILYTRQFPVVRPSSHVWDNTGPPPICGRPIAHVADPVPLALYLKVPHVADPVPLTFTSKCHTWQTQCHSHSLCTSKCHMWQTQCNSLCTATHGGPSATCFVPQGAN